MPKIYTWTIAQAQLIPDPSNPAVGSVGIRSVVKIPGKLRWQVTLDQAQLGTPDYSLIATAITDELQPGTARIFLNPFPPTGPVSTFEVAVVGADGVTVLADPIIASVMFRVDRKAPVSFVP